jgi:glycosyltransferase involved in cell wall biosynthesis
MDHLIDIEESRHILILTDAWHPQINGVVTTTDETVARLEKRGNKVTVIHPGLFYTIALPYYPGVRLPLDAQYALRSKLEGLKPDYIHIATEGPIGFAGRAYCLSKKLAFTTAYHTNWPEYLSEWNFSAVSAMMYQYLRWFHSKSSSVMVTTEALVQHLKNHRFKKVVLCPLGVNTELFTPRDENTADIGMERPIFGYLGRVGSEKNVEEFMALSLPGTKLIIGDGPLRSSLEAKYAMGTKFVGYQRGGDLVRHLSNCDVLVMPSLTETFGIVILEALACGVPVAGHNVAGPREILSHGVDGYLHEDLAEAAMACLSLSKVACREKALRYSWNESVDMFLNHLVPAHVPDTSH